MEQGRIAGTLAPGAPGDQPKTESPLERPHSRRAILAGGLGGIVSLLAGVLGRPSPASAANGSAVLVGRTNSGSASTTVSTTSGIGLQGKCSSPAGRGVCGSTTSTSGRTLGVYGVSASPNGDGVRGLQNAAASGSGAAVRAVGQRNDGLVATTAGAADKAAIRAHRVGTDVPGSVLVVTSSTTGGTDVDPNTQPGAVQVVTDAYPAVVAYARNSAAEGNQAVFARADGGNAAAVWAANYSNGATGGCALLAETDSPDGIAVWGQNTMGGWAGWFDGPVHLHQYVELQAVTTPPAPSETGRARLFIRDNAGKSELCVRFSSGAVVAIATEP